MNGVSVSEVAAFIGPLIVSIGLVGGFVAWAMARTGRYINAQITSVQNVTNERIATLTQQLQVQGKILENQQKELQDTSKSVARIEGRLAGSMPTSHE